MSTKTKPTPTATEQQEARRRLTAIRNALGRADALLVEAWKARDWLALGHASWKAYVAAELPQLQLLQVRAEVRDERIVELAREGMSQGAIADGFGIGRGTVNRALAGVELDETVTATDGRTMARRAPKAPARRRGPRKTDRTVELAQGLDTFDVRDVVHATRWPQHKASATLTRLVQAGRLEYLPPARRGLFGRYRTVAG